jgi:hypothetical protein
MTNKERAKELVDNIWMQRIRNIALEVLKTSNLHVRVYPPTKEEYAYAEYYLDTHFPDIATELRANEIKKEESIAKKSKRTSKG